MADDSITGIGWYVSDVHCRRAIDYLGEKLGAEGHLTGELESSQLLKMWGEALANTLDVREPSPIGPDPELAKAIVLEFKMAEPKTEVDRRMDRIEEAIDMLATHLLASLNGFHEEDYEGIRKILDGRTQTTSEDSPSSAD